MRGKFARKKKQVDVKRLIEERVGHRVGVDRKLKEQRLKEQRLKEQRLKEQRLKEQRLKEQRIRDEPIRPKGRHFVVAMLIAIVIAAGLFTFAKA